MTYNILVPIGCRSDEGLSAPVIRRLKNNNIFCVKTIKLVPQDFKASYEIAEYHCKAQPHIGNSDPFKPDLILITGDRVEMCAAAAAAFHNKVKIAHLYAGVVNDPVTTFDDIDRHCITLWSDIQFCENEETHRYVCYIKYTLRTLNTLNSNVVGITHLDDMEIDETKVPNKLMKALCLKDENKGYDLILYNSPSKESSQPDIYSIEEIIGKNNNYSVLIGGNPDGDHYTKLISLVDEYYMDLPRSQFIGLLKNCQRFITNSSSAIYEAPYFLKPEQIIMIGDRNRNRPKVKCESGGSDRIVEILKIYANKKV